MELSRETQSETNLFKSQNRELTLHLVVDLLGPHLACVALRALEDGFHQLAHRPRTRPQGVQGELRGTAVQGGALRVFTVAGGFGDDCEYVAEVEALLLDCVCVCVCAWCVCECVCVCVWV